MSTIARREFLSQTAVACGTLAATGVLGDTAPARRSPNLLFVVPDQMRGSAMGFLHEEPVVTPERPPFCIPIRHSTFSIHGTA